MNEPQLIRAKRRWMLVFALMAAAAVYLWALFVISQDNAYTKTELAGGTQQQVEPSDPGVRPGREQSVKKRP